MIIVLAAWMLDRAACADMVIGAPRAELAALVELHHLLIERGFRRSSLCDPRIVKEEQNEHFAEVGFDHGSNAGRGSASDRVPWAVCRFPRPAGSVATNACADLEETCRKCANHGCKFVIEGY